MSKRMTITLNSEAVINLKKYAKKLDTSLAEAFRRQVMMGMYFTDLLESGNRVFKSNDKGEVVELEFPWAEENKPNIGEITREQLDKMEPMENPHNDKHETMVKKLDGFLALQPNWNSYGAEPISVKAVREAAGFISFIERKVSEFSKTIPDAIPTDCVPLPNGGVQLEYDSESESIEVEIDSTGKVRYLYTASTDGKRKFEEVGVDTVYQQQVMVNKFRDFFCMKSLEVDKMNEEYGPETGGDN